MYNYFPRRECFSDGTRRTHLVSRKVRLMWRHRNHHIEWSNSSIRTPNQNGHHFKISQSINAARLLETWLMVLLPGTATHHPFLEPQYWPWLCDRSTECDSFKYTKFIKDTKYTNTREKAVIMYLTWTEPGGESPLEDEAPQAARSLRSSCPSLSRPPLSSRITP
jgi:hypothetical protein